MPSRADHTLDQPLERYTDLDHDTWRQLYARQSALLPGRASNSFLAGLQALDLPTDHIPSFETLNQKIGPVTGWQLVAVPGRIPDEVFFEHLANRRFPATWWIRRPEQMDYIGEPDVFHELFGHAPLLIHPVFANYLQAFGEGGRRAARLDVLPFLNRLYWHTVEFGLINGAYGLRIYGAGILSSKSESIHALESYRPNRIGFNLARVMRTEYTTEVFQPTYFVINSFRQLFTATLQDFGPLYAQIRNQSVHAAGDIAANDLILQRGNPGAP